MTTRDRIIEAATWVFLRYGYRLTSMEAVAQEAGLTRQALYHHFAAKEALFRAVVAALFDAAQAAAEAAGMAAGDGDLAAVLSAQIMARWAFFADRLKVSPHAEELMTEHHRQTADLHADFVARTEALTAGTIERFTGGALASGTRAADLARCLYLAEAGAKAVKMQDGTQDGAQDGTQDDLRCIIGLLVRGAVAPAGDPPGDGSRAR